MYMRNGVSVVVRVSHFLIWCLEINISFLDKLYHQNVHLVNSQLKDTTCGWIQQDTTGLLVILPNVDVFCLILGYSTSDSVVSAELNINEWFMLRNDIMTTNPGQYFAGWLSLTYT